MKVSVIAEGYGINGGDWDWACRVASSLGHQLLKQKGCVKLVTISLKQSSAFDASMAHLLEVATVLIFEVLGQEIKAEVTSYSEGSEGNSLWLSLGYPRGGKTQFLKTRIESKQPEEFAKGLYRLVKLFLGDLAEAREAEAGILRKAAEVL